MICALNALASVQRLLSSGAVTVSKVVGDPASDKEVIATIGMQTISSIADNLLLRGRTGRVRQLSTAHSQGQQQSRASCR